MAMENLKDLFLTELRDLYSAEKQILSALPKMAKAASSEALKDAFAQHRDQTEEHVNRLEQIFESLDIPARAKKCQGIAGIIEEGSEFLKKNIDAHVRDAALIASAQKVEHYEMAGYGTARTWAKLLGEEKAAGLLQQTLNEEAETDETLTGIAEQINTEAEHGELEEQAAASSERGRHSQ